MREFAVGDIHGCCKTFKKLLTEEINIQPSDKVYCVGDYIDRGEDSKGVIDFIIELRSKGFLIYTLRGNHEQMMLDSTLNKEYFYQWVLNGGDSTLESFEIDSFEELSSVYQDFLNNTELYITTDKHVFVHAGLNFRNDNPFEDEQAMLWTREAYFDAAKIDFKVLVHGHTPIALKSILNQKNANRINIDGGCVYTSRKGFGNLVALDLNEQKFITVENID